jgi:hypothetical protein
MKYYRAPWGTSLITTSTVVTVLGIAFALLFLPAGIYSLFFIIPLLTMLFVFALFTIRGYTITKNAILVHRLLWKTSLPLTGLRKIEFKPDAMRLRDRRAGNGGLYSFSGYFANDSLGYFRVFVTDLHRTIALHYQSEIILVSPDKSDEFVSEIKAMGYAA